MNATGEDCNETTKGRANAENFHSNGGGFLCITCFLNLRLPKLNVGGILTN